MSRKIEDLIPEMQAKAREFAGLMAEAAIAWMITRIGTGDTIFYVYVMR
jgi:hypothetical protein